MRDRSLGDPLQEPQECLTRKATKGDGRGELKPRTRKENLLSWVEWGSKKKSCMGPRVTFYFLLISAMTWKDCLDESTSSTPLEKTGTVEANGVGPPIVVIPTDTDNDEPEIGEQNCNRARPPTTTSKWDYKTSVVFGESIA